MTISDIPPFLLGCALGALTCLWCWLVERKLRKDEKEMDKGVFPPPGYCERCHTLRNGKVRCYLDDCQHKKPAFDADEYRKELRQKINKMEEKP